MTIDIFPQESKILLVLPRRAAIFQASINNAAMNFFVARRAATESSVDHMNFVLRVPVTRGHLEPAISAAGP